jgi:hypothetical protein
MGREVGIAHPSDKYPCEELVAVFRVVPRSATTDCAISHFLTPDKIHGTASLKLIIVTANGKRIDLSNTQV